MIATKLALVGGVLIVAALCVLAAIGFTPAVGPLVTAALLVVFIAGGNLADPRRQR